MIEQINRTSSSSWAALATYLQSECVPLRCRVDAEVNADDLSGFEDFLSLPELIGALGASRRGARSLGRGF